MKFDFYVCNIMLQSATVYSTLPTKTNVLRHLNEFAYIGGERAEECSRERATGKRCKTNGNREDGKNFIICRKLLCCAHSMLQLLDVFDYIQINCHGLLFILDMLTCKTAKLMLRGKARQ